MRKRCERLAALICVNLAMGGIAGVTHGAELSNIHRYEIVFGNLERFESTYAEEESRKITERLMTLAREVTQASFKVPSSSEDASLCVFERLSVDNFDKLEGVNSGRSFLARLSSVAVTALEKSEEVDYIEALNSPGTDELSDYHRYYILFFDQEERDSRSYLVDTGELPSEAAVRLIVLAKETTRNSTFEVPSSFSDSVNINNFDEVQHVNDSVIARGFTARLSPAAVEALRKSPEVCSVVPATVVTGAAGIDSPVGPE